MPWIAVFLAADNGFVGTSLASKALKITVQIGLLIYLPVVNGLRRLCSTWKALEAVYVTARFH